MLGPVSDRALLSYSLYSLGPVSDRALLSYSLYSLGRRPARAKQDRPEQNRTGPSEISTILAYHHSLRPIVRMVTFHRALTQVSHRSLRLPVLRQNQAFPVTASPHGDGSRSGDACHQRPRRLSVVAFELSIVAAHLLIQLPEGWDRLTPWSVRYPARWPNVSGYPWHRAGHAKSFHTKGMPR